jgi:hypothetical protein
VNGEFNWWLLILGLVIGAGLVWLVLADTRRRDADVEERERQSEARWIGEAMRDAGRRISDADALDVLRLHDAYLAAPPPDEIVDESIEPDPLPAPTRHVAGSAAVRNGVADARPPMAHPAGATERLEGER